jgi:hypothetical protein
VLAVLILAFLTLLLRLPSEAVRGLLVLAGIALRRPN